jgi:crotonobetainyl-CoA:carnitine CoA-transferase CaiB-like acyl-CoA transferase
MACRVGVGTGECLFRHAPQRWEQACRAGLTLRAGGPNDYVFITAQQQMWPAMVEAMGRPELADDPRFNAAEMRWENRQALNAS